MTTPIHAVFLSYASQDAEAARRLAEALRAEGIEVWFDQDELVGGDAWDAKIRRQIGECELFLPVISASTEARMEGYFRLEWKIAAQRTHTMADEKAFLLPIVIDGTRDASAKVPPEFKAVQWTRLPAGETTPAFRARVKKLLAAEDDAAESSVAAYTPAGAARSERNKIGRWIGYGWAALGIGMGVFFMARPLWWDRKPRPAKPVEVGPPAPADPAKAAAPVSPKLDPQRVVLARFENLSGDASLDPLARLIEGELTRSFAAVQMARVLPVEASGRSAGRAAAREAGAAAVIVGSFVRLGDQIEISAEIVLAAEGDSFGSAGPVTAPATTVRGPGLTELSERLATGVFNLVVTLQNPPARLSTVIYNRPWPRWSDAVRAQALRAKPGERVDDQIEAYRSLLRAAPEMLKVKHDLAKLLRDFGRVDEAQALFRELLRDDRGRLSEAEIQTINYDEALLAGDPDRALTAARSLAEIRPVSDAITQAVACLWAQNRPRAAWEELSAWWERHGKTMPEASRASTEAGLHATEALMHLQENAPEKALASLAQLQGKIGHQPFVALHWMRFMALGLLGREAEQAALVNEVAALTGGVRIEPVALQWTGYCQALHLGRPDAAQRWLAEARRSWTMLAESGRVPENLDTVAIWLSEAAGRPEAALEALARLEKRYPGLINVVGARALVLRAMGRVEEAQIDERRLEQWEPRNSRGLPEYWRARIAARAGDKERAVLLLRQALAGGLWFGGFQSPTFDYGRNEPEFAPLRGYAPYEELLRPKG